MRCTYVFLRAWRQELALHQDHYSTSSFHFIFMLHHGLLYGHSFMQWLCMFSRHRLSWYIAPLTFFSTPYRTSGARENTHVTERIIFNGRSKMTAISLSQAQLRPGQIVDSSSPLSSRFTAWPLGYLLYMYLLGGLAWLTVHPTVLLRAALCS